MKNKWERQSLGLVDIGPVTARFYPGDHSLRQNWTDYWQSTTAKAWYVLLQQLDLALTALAMSLGLWEHNPVMRSLLTTPFQLVTVKLLIPLIIVWLVPGKLLVPAVLFLGLVVGWNVKELLFFFL